MLISQNADNNNAKMNAADLNNADTIKEKTNSLKAQRIRNINNLKQIKNCDEKNKSFCNDELKKHVSLLFIVLFFLTLVGAAFAFCFITFTNKFNENIVENLILKNGTKSMEWWIDSPIQPLIKIHIFNYTNIDDFLSGKDEKIKLKDVGPYVYKEFGSRVNLEFTEDHKITFNDNKSLIFMPNESVGKEGDIFKVPNVPLIASIAKAAGIDFFSSQAFNIILSSSGAKEFHDKTVSEYMFGYTDPLVERVPGLNRERAGLISGRKGVAVDNLTIYTGEDSLDNLGKIHAMNGETKLNIWNTSECNEIEGTDGSQFAPHMIDQDKELKIFIKSFCRPLRLKFEREVTVLNGIPAWRYKVPEGGFDSSWNNPENTCYCDSSDESTWCPPDGVFDASKCVDGIPLMLSYPHFLEGNSSLFELFEGLNPDRLKHETFADIHERMAFPIGGASRLQMNFRIKAKEIGGFFKTDSWYKKLDDVILPLFWFEVTAGEIPPEFQSLVFHTTHSANATYLAIQYGSLVTAFVSLLLVLSTFYIYLNWLKRKPSKIQNNDVIVTFQSLTNHNCAQQLYPTISNQSD